MYARLTTLRVQPDRFDAARTLLQTLTMPALRQQPGFAGGYWLTDAERHTLVVVTLWATAAALRAAETIGYDPGLRAQLRSWLREPSEQATYEVSAHL